MTQDEIIETAREAGGSDVGGHGWTTWVGTQSTEFLERFAILIAAKEREACAKLCDSTIEQTYISGYTGAVHSARRECAAAIRAKGQT